MKGHVQLPFDLGHQACHCVVTSPCTWRHGEVLFLRGKAFTFLQLAYIEIGVWTKWNKILLPSPLRFKQCIAHHGCACIGVLLTMTVRAPVCLTLEGRQFHDQQRI